METTPSLACANKCVFCWRHHSNPVGTEWKWKMDPAETVLEGALENHYKMIKQMKGETLDRPRGSRNVLGSLLPVLLAT